MVDPPCTRLDAIPYTAVWRSRSRDPTTLGAATRRPWEPPPDRGRHGGAARGKLRCRRFGFGPPVPTLDPARAASVLAAGLRAETVNDPLYSCFPLEPGASATATVTPLPGVGPLRKPLEVTCSSAIAPDPMGLWRVTLTQSWSKAADRTAGELTTVLWVANDGSVSWTANGPTPSDMPYAP